MSFADTLAASGSKAKLMFDMMGWFSDGKVHRVTRYSSIDPEVIANQLTLIKVAGGAGVRFTWEGPQNTFVHQAAMEICDQCEGQGLLFALIINPQVASQPNWWLDPGFLTMCNSPAYILEKWLCDFSTGINYSKVVLPAGFSVLMNQVGFGWVNAQAPVNNATALQQIQNTNKLATMMWPFLCLNFFDPGYPLPAGVLPANFTGTRDLGHTVWDVTKSARTVDHEGGNFFHDTVAAALLCPQAKYAALRWNDADEGDILEAFMSAWCGMRIGK